MKTSTGNKFALALTFALFLFDLAPPTGAQVQAFRQRGGTFGSGTKMEGDRKTNFATASTYDYKVLYNFCPGGASCTDGQNPYSSLVRDAAGNLYGTTQGGGAAAGGTVFKLDISGNETVLYSFCSEANCVDGAYPNAGLIQDSQGNLYGTTTQGGANGRGTALELNSNNQESVLYSFCSASECADGIWPYASLILDAAGNLYGTTSGAGAFGGGTVFEVNNSGIETLYNFCSLSNCADGQAPKAALVQDAAGNFYGTTVYGGNKYGTVFELDSLGVETVLYAFCAMPGCTDGSFPNGSLILDSAGNIFGTTYDGGSGTNGVGTIFKVDNADHETVPYSFCSVAGCTDGDLPTSALIQDTGGNFYGTTFEGGAVNWGTVFKLDQNNQETVLHSFGSGNDGGFPAAALIPDSGGNLYGTTSGGGAYGRGTVFELVAIYATTTTLASSLNPSTYGQAVTFTATVTSAGPTPTGTVTFKNGTTSLGSGSLSSGVAKLKTSTLPAGTLSITATYPGDTANAGSTSKVLKQVVHKATSTSSVTSSVNPSTVGQKVAFTATVTSTTTTPTGTVKFMDGAKLLGTGTLAKGKTAFSTSSLSKGSHNITAVYEGTVNITGSTSPILVQVVN